MLSSCQVVVCSLELPHHVANQRFEREATRLSKKKREVTALSGEKKTATTSASLREWRGEMRGDSCVFELCVCVCS